MHGYRLVHIPPLAGSWLMHRIHRSRRMHGYRLMHMPTLA
jgi:hypothetical protein